MSESKKISDVEAMTRIKRIMAQLVEEDRDLVSRWICDKYGVDGVVRFSLSAAADAAAAAQRS